ncbi:hypothetical protein NV226_01615 [Mycoplasma iguanae]|uniref:Uncharacterized protein n=1 Tax=Mycoplasma iguanae TaxID=292461 RepID=A0ABY5R9I6_9MOLU|nr:hypothetical protein [Mycoplasma iguanae]UVD81986.1 hypothetical protein NV226_01615 [Mycoplasma iguanae]
MKLTKWSKIGALFSATSLIGLTIGGYAYWASRDFRPVIMNFESYVSPEAEKEINKHFQYKVFQELNEFSRAIESQRIVGGFASDFEIARLIISGKLSKIKYEKILRNIPELQGDNTSKAFEANGMIKKSIVQKYLRTETMEHIDSYNSYLKDSKGNIIDIDKDGKADEMWEFMIPYYIQDKVIAYTTGGYKTNQNDSENLTPLRPDSYNVLTPEEREQGIAFEDQTFTEILKKLRTKNYSKFTWTEASRDNLLIGSEVENSDANKPGQITYSGEVTPSNYRSMVEGFLKVVREGTGDSVSNINTNKFVSSGTDILQSLIEPGNPSDAGVIYNGDALDALYSGDNFANVPDGQINYIRPKNNITLLEGFVFASYNNEATNDKIYDILYESIYRGIDMTTEELFKEILSVEKIPFMVENEEGEWVAETTIDENGKTVEIWEKDGKENYGVIIDYSAVAITRNFDYINYTSSWKADFEVIKKMYFNNAVTTTAEESSIIHVNEKPLMFEMVKDVEEGDLETKLEEIKSALNIDEVSEDVSDAFSQKLLNIFVTQQKYQTITGGMPTEDTPADQIYEVHYESIKPINDQLRSEVITYYNIKTKS